MQTALGATRPLSDTIDIGYLDPAQATFYETPGGFTGLAYKGADHKRVALRRALPIGNPDEYISIADEENKEIAILRSLKDLPDDALRIVQHELNRRYHCPVVKEILSVKDKLGYVYMELEVRAPEAAQQSKGTYRRNCAIKDVNKNIRMLGEDQLLLFDVDGNRFLIQSLAALPKKSLRQLEPYLF